MGSSWKGAGGEEGSAEEEKEKGKEWKWNKRKSRGRRSWRRSMHQFKFKDGMELRVDWKDTFSPVSLIYYCDSNVVIKCGVPICPLAIFCLCVLHAGY